MLTQIVSRFCAKCDIVTSCWRSPVIGALVILICIQNGKFYKANQGQGSYNHKYNYIILF